MTATTLDPRLHADAIKAAVKAQLGPNNVYSYGQVPGSDGNAGTLPNIFVLVSIERTYTPNLNMAAKAGTSGWRVSVTSVGDTVKEAGWAMFAVATALNETRLVIDGHQTTPLRFESDQTPTRDKDRFSGSAFFTYHH